jgi:hypothetical protein
MRLRRSTLSLYSPDVESLVGFLGLYKNREEYEINEENHRLLVVLNEAIANAFVSIPLDNQQLKLICQTMNIL